MISPARSKAFVWKLPLNERDAADLKYINGRLERLRAVERELLRWRHSIMQRARLAYRLKQGWRPHPATRLERSTQKMETNHD